jgi:hypothetical protein
MANHVSEDNYFEDENLSTYTPIPMMAQAKRMWRRSDLYAIPITLRYKGEKSFYTNFGALASLLVILTMIGFTISYTHVMLDNSKISSSYLEKFSNAKLES